MDATNRSWVKKTLHLADASLSRGDFFLSDVSVVFVYMRPVQYRSELGATRQSSIGQNSGATRQSNNAESSVTNAFHKKTNNNEKTTLQSNHGPETESTSTHEMTVDKTARMTKIYTSAGQHETRQKRYKCYTHRAQAQTKPDKR